MAEDQKQYNSLLAQINAINQQPAVTASEKLILDVFHFQRKHNPTYAWWCDLVGNQVDHNIPFLPISFYKSHIIKTGGFQEETIFTSSGTTADVPSRNYIRSEGFYLRQAASIFTDTYGPLQEYCILALLPSYLERTGSSLIRMVDYFIAQSAYRQSGFYLYNHEELLVQLYENKEAGIPTVLFGVSFALLDFVEHHKIDFPGLIVIETGGMKGRRKEIIRSELHDRLAYGFGVRHIHSEYGMTELMSQAYAVRAGLFKPSASMQVFTREIQDPFTPQKPGKVGALNIVDLLNLDTCSFIATDDLGIVHTDGSFEVLGRLDQSERRGCSLLTI